MKQYLIPLVSIFLFALAACSGTFEVGVEQTPTPNHAATATISALVEENARLATRVAQQITPAPVKPQLGQLAFVQGGDIWIKELPDGKPQRLTADGRDSKPRWSPSGQWIAFRKERPIVIEQAVPCDLPNPRPGNCSEPVASIQPQVWIVGADDNGAHPLLQGAPIDTFAWSPNDDRIAYLTVAGELQIATADNGKPTTLVAHAGTDGKPGQVGRFLWNRDGTEMVYEWRMQTTGQVVTYQGIWKVNVDNQERAELYASGTPKKGEVLLAATSASGSALFWQADTRAAVAVEGEPLYGLAPDKNGSEADAPPGHLGSDLVLTYSDFVAPAPVGTSFATRGAAALVVGRGRSTWSNKGVVLASGERLDSNPITPKNLAAISPSWAPDASSLAFVAMPDQPDLDAGEIAVQALMQRHIWLINTSGEPHPRLLTSASYRDERPLWSVDGSYILFARVDAKGQSSLWIIPAAGGNPQQVVEELTPAVDPLGFYGHIEWDGLFDWWRGRGS